MKGPEDRKINSSMFPTGYNIEQTNKALEGGNLFICENKAGVKYYILGEHALENDYIIDNHRQMIEEEHKDGYDPENYHQKNYSKKDRDRHIAQYEKIFEVDGVNSKLLILPSITFHLDLYIAYISKARFILDFAVFN